MISFGTNFDQNDLFSETDNKICLNNLSYEQDPIDLFLNQDVFFGRSQKIKQSDSSCELSNTDDPSASSKASQIKETHQILKKKSIFHNFQKHLITLIKKTISLRQDTHANLGHTLVSQLWTAFMKTRQFNKKILHIVFGVMQNSKAKEELSKLSEQFPEFKLIFSQNSVSDIIQAQRLIRERFVDQASSQTKQEVETKCHVNRFEQFYEYYRSFVCELKTGPMTKRMTKNRKSDVLQRLDGRTAQN